ncbi:MAG: hypothetical protein Q8K64_05405 [Sediminibacterium sp.]|nr:hypothetical protein [Sediminibacterium sp.]
MNLLFVSVLLFCFLIPGFVFRLCYFSPPFSRKFQSANLISDLTWSILPGLIFHFLGAIVIQIFSEYSILFNYVGSLLLITNDKVLANTIFTNIQSHLAEILLYNVILIFLAGVSGYLAKYLVRKLKIDRKYRTFRFSNKWHYIMTGECLDFPHINDQFNDINVRLIDILCQNGKEEQIYTGELFEWYTDDKGELDTIHIRYPMRRKLSDDYKDKDRFHRIPSRYLIIPYKTVLNINVRYFNVNITAKS